MIDDTISCSFCGANLKPTNSNNPYLTCEFCGSVTVNKIFQEKKSKINKIYKSEKINLKIFNYNKSKEIFLRINWISKYPME